MQKFKDGLSLELQHDVHGFDLPTLGELVNKAKAMEEIRETIKAQKSSQKGMLGKRSFG